MDTCFIFGVPGVLLEGCSDDRRSEVAGVIGELILQALESAGDGRAASATGEAPTGEVRLLCEPDLDEIATYIWSGGWLQELDAAPDIDLRETLDSVEREVVARWKRKHPGYEFVVD